MNARIARAAAAVLAASPAWLLAATHTVTIDSMRFEPAELVVAPGDTVVWTNKDPVPHTVTARGRFDSGAIAPDKTWSWVAGRRGTLSYVCTYHPGMQAMLIVR